MLMSYVFRLPNLDLKSSLKKPVLWALAACVLMSLATLFMPDYYKSEARLLPVESKGLGGSLGGLASAAAAFGVSIPGGDSSDANFVDVINSRWMKEQILRTEFQYTTRSWRFGAILVKKGTLYDYLESKNMDRAIGEMDKVLFCSRDLKSKVITISSETKSPELSQLIVQQVGRLLEVFLQEKGRTRGSAKATFAEARLAEARREMDEAEEILLRFLEGNRNFQSSSDPSVRLRGSRLETELRLRQQLVSSIALNREQALMEEKNDMPILNIMDPGNLPIEKSKPARSVIVLLFTFFVGGISWIGLNREWLLQRLAEDKAPSADFSP